MKKKKVLIFGGTGFVGRNIAQRFADNPEYQVYATFFTRQPWDHPHIEWYNVDSCNDAMVDSLINGMDIVVQAAAVTSGCKDTFERPWLHVTDNAVMNSYIFRAAMLRKVKHVIWFSCSTMYGGGHCSEETPVNPNSRYFGMVSTKLYLEKMAAFFADQGETKFTAIRGSNFYGPWDKYALDRAHVFGATVTKVKLAGDHIDVWGNGSEARDICYIDDLVDFVECALDKQESKFGLYNCGYGTSFTIREIVTEIVVASGKSLAINYDTSKPSIQVSTSLDCKRAESDLGWTPKTSLVDGIKKTLGWYSDNF
jgi:nucleoside-diphosphate-sugar epimerase